MKKRLGSILLILTFILLAGCGTMPGQQSTGSPPSASSQDQIQDKTVPSPADTSSLIGEDKVKAIALEKAGIPDENIRFDRVELDRDGGVWKYEVEFSQGQTEYDFEIKADDGTILSYETDFRD